MSPKKFAVTGAEAELFSPVPLINLKLNLQKSNPDKRIQSIYLRCQLQIEITRRLYNFEEKEGLMKLFDEYELFGQNMQSLFWTETCLCVPLYDECGFIELPVSCAFDKNNWAVRYFEILEGGEIPLKLVFSGTCFYRDKDSNLHFAEISGENTSDYCLPVRLWQKLLNYYKPNGLEIEKCAGHKENSESGSDIEILNQKYQM